MKTVTKLQLRAFTLNREYKTISQELEEKAELFNYLCDSADPFMDSMGDDHQDLYFELCDMDFKLGKIQKDLLECEGEFLVLVKRSSHKHRWANHSRNEKGRKSAQDRYLKDCLSRQKKRIAETQMKLEAEEAMDELQRPWVFEEYWEEIQERETFLDKEIFMNNVLCLYEDILEEISEGNLVLEDKAREMAELFDFDLVCLERAVRSGISSEMEEDFDVSYDAYGETLLY